MRFVCLGVVGGTCAALTKKAERRAVPSKLSNSRTSRLASSGSSRSTEEKGGR